MLLFDSPIEKAKYLNEMYAKGARAGLSAMIDTLELSMEQNGDYEVTISNFIELIKDLQQNF